MKRFFVFTLIALFALTCLLITNLPADDHLPGDGYQQKSKTVHNVDISASVYTGYTDEYGYVSAMASAINNSNIPVRYYYSASGSMRGIVKDDSSQGWVSINDYFSGYNWFTFNLGPKNRRRTVVSGNSSILVKFDFDGDGTFDDSGEVDASAETVFWW